MGKGIYRPIDQRMGDTNTAFINYIAVQGIIYIPLSNRATLYGNITPIPTHQWLYTVCNLQVPFRMNLVLTD